MVLDEADHAVLLRERDELVVVLNRLHGWFGDEHVELALDGVLCDVVVRVCEADVRDGCQTAWLTDVLSGVKMITAAPGESWSIAVLSAFLV